jgi:predicted RNase H-like HicB family nuclease
MHYQGFYLATSEDIPGLVAQGRTIAETIEIARDIAKKLLEARQEQDQPIQLAAIEKMFNYDIPQKLDR